MISHGNNIAPLEGAFWPIIGENPEPLAYIDSKDLIKGKNLEPYSPTKDIIELQQNANNK